MAHEELIPAGERDAETASSAKRESAGRSEAGQALFRACKDGDIETVERLIASGFDVEASAGHPDTAIGSRALHFAALHGHLSIAKSLLEAGADPNARNFGGDAPIHGASYRGHLDLIKALLEAGADIEARSGLGLTALGCSIAAGKDATSNALLELGAKAASAAKS